MPVVLAVVTVNSVTTPKTGVDWTLSVSTVIVKLTPPDAGSTNTVIVCPTNILEVLADTILNPSTTLPDSEVTCTTEPSVIVIKSPTT